MPAPFSRAVSGPPAQPGGNRGQTNGNDPGREVVPFLVVIHVFSFRIF